MLEIYRSLSIKIMLRKLYFNNLKTTVVKYYKIQLFTLFTNKFKMSKGAKNVNKILYVLPIKIPQSVYKIDNSMVYKEHFAIRYVSFIHSKGYFFNSKR